MTTPASASASASTSASASDPTAASASDPTAASVSTCASVSTAASASDPTAASATAPAPDPAPATSHSTTPDLAPAAEPAAAPDLELLRRLAGNVMAASAQGRKVIDVGPFRLFISPDEPLRYYNYAVPVRECADWTPWLLELCQVFEAHQRLPRFEYFTGLWPTLRAALEATGFELELFAPVMTLAGPDLVEPPAASASIRLLTADDPSTELADYTRVGAIGFGLTLSQIHEAAEASTPQKEVAGTRFRALARVDGVAAACGLLMRSGDVAEMAGVATIPAFRRRGIAADLCYRLLRIGFDAGLDLVWLSAADEGAVKLYRMLGFHHSGEQLHISRPTPLAAP